ncbi:MAG: hypothetical protein DRR08_12790 [Candidatus Parabeggiatoa sp. nov. 2]|nr:MAG: hypothetical protein B6247_07420 [Beggiatoa sp. 4572_84]RKZ59848.1 MAG: hypothetical protein DRR08_12790 [Gammaproteobacteria bacterium]
MTQENAIDFLLAIGYTIFKISLYGTYLKKLKMKWVQILLSPVKLKVIANQLVIEFGVFGVTTITD